jgi:hypothetical protein
MYGLLSLSLSHLSPLVTLVYNFFVPMVCTGSSVAELLVVLPFLTVRGRYNSIWV